MSEVEHVLAVNNKLGEGPVWCSEEQALYWVDIESNCFYRMYPTSMKYEVFEVGSLWTALSEEQKKKQPYSGDLFRVKTDIKGLEKAKFVG